MTMFDRSVYAARRSQLRQQLTSVNVSGLLLILGNSEVATNSPYNHYRFCQDASFSYFFGLNHPDLVGVIDLDAGVDSLFGDDASDEAVLWAGPQASFASCAALVDIAVTQPYSTLKEVIALAQQQNKTIHYLPPYRAESLLELTRLLGGTTEQVVAGVSQSFIDAVVHQREIKSEAEIAEIECALAVTKEMHIAAMRQAMQGKYEYEVVATIDHILGNHNTHGAYPHILTKNGEILHSRDHSKCLNVGDLVINDSGAVSPLGYASDITRTIPVGGKFSDRQRIIYEIVLRAQQRCIAAIRPGISYLELHKLAALTLVEGLMPLGFFHGDAKKVVDSGAYAICFPHGLGHQMGLDVHDMEALGENNVGYDASVARSGLFGLRNLRLAKKLQAGMVLTVEPGIYFIPALIQRWQAEAKHADMINYDRFTEYKDFGGIRIEDNVLVTAIAARVLGPAIPKTCDEIEAVMAEMFEV